MGEETRAQQVKSCVQDHAAAQLGAVKGQKNGRGREGHKGTKVPSLLVGLDSPISLHLCLSPALSPSISLISPFSVLFLMFKDPFRPPSLSCVRVLAPCHGLGREVG